jgi:hypothetical protein
MKRLSHSLKKKKRNQHIPNNMYGNVRGSHGFLIIFCIVKYDIEHIMAKCSYFGLYLCSHHYFVNGNNVLLRYCFLFDHLHHF